MSKQTIINVLEKFKKVEDGYLDQDQKGEDEQRFIDKHADNVQTTDAVGKAEHDKIKKSSKMASRKNHGYEPGEDAKVYEESSADDMLDDLIEAVINEFLEEEADADEAETLREMLSTEEGYAEFLDIILSEEDEKCPECGCDECECDGDDEVIDASPKIKKEKSGRETDMASEDVTRTADTKLVKVKLPDGKVVWRKSHPETSISKATD